MQLAQNGLKPSDILTRAAFENAIKVHAALSGSTNALLHLPAVAHELDIEIDAGLFDEINREIPYLVDVQPSGKHVSEMVWYAGGVPRVQLELKDMLDLDVMTVTGKTLRENLEQLEAGGFFQRGEGYLANYRLRREDVIYPRGKSQSFGSIAVLRGNLAPEGAVVKFSAVPTDMLQHKGPARVFDNEEAALNAVMSGRVEPGSVIILRYEGPRGCGMPEILSTTEALVTNPALQHTAIITDGRFSGATRGPCIGHVSPEAVAGGPIALVEDGDMILIDIPARTLDIVGSKDRRMEPQEVETLLAERKKSWAPVVRKHPPGILRRYSKQAVSAIKGAYLK
jgi:dihydroxy-acid dehydratase